MEENKGTAAEVKFTDRYEECVTQIKSDLSGPHKENFATLPFESCMFVYHRKHFKNLDLIMGQHVETFGDWGTVDFDLVDPGLPKIPTRLKAESNVGFGADSTITLAAYNEGVKLCDRALILTGAQHLLPFENKHLFTDHGVDICKPEAVINMAQAVSAAYRNNAEFYSSGAGVGVGVTDTAFERMDEAFLGHLWSSHFPHVPVDTRDQYTIILALSRRAQLAYCCSVTHEKVQNRENNAFTSKGKKSKKKNVKVRTVALYAGRTTLDFCIHNGFLEGKCAHRFTTGESQGLTQPVAGQETDHTDQKPAEADAQYFPADCQLVPIYLVDDYNLKRNEVKSFLDKPEAAQSFGRELCNVIEEYFLHTPETVIPIKNQMQLYSMVDCLLKAGSPSAWQVKPTEEELSKVDLTDPESRANFALQMARKWNSVEMNMTNNSAERISCMSDVEKKTLMTTKYLLTRTIDVPALQNGRGNINIHGEDAYIGLNGREFPSIDTSKLGLSSDKVVKDAISSRYAAERKRAELPSNELQHAFNTKRVALDRIAKHGVYDHDTHSVLNGNDMTPEQRQSITSEIEATIVQANYNMDVCLLLDPHSALYVGKISSDVYIKKEGSKYSGGNDKLKQLKQIAEKKSGKPDGLDSFGEIPLSAVNEIAGFKVGDAIGACRTLCRPALHFSTEIKNKTTVSDLLFRIGANLSCASMKRIMESLASYITDGKPELLEEVMFAEDNTAFSSTRLKKKTMRTDSPEQAPTPAEECLACQSGLPMYNPDTRKFCLCMLVGAALCKMKRTSLRDMNMYLALNEFYDNLGKKFNSCSVLSDSAKSNKLNQLMMCKRNSDVLNKFGTLSILHADDGFKFKPRDKNGKNGAAIECSVESSTTPGEGETSTDGPASTGESAGTEGHAGPTTGPLDKMFNTKGTEPAAVPSINKIESGGRTGTGGEKNSKYFKAVPISSLAKAVNESTVMFPGFQPLSSSELEEHGVNELSTYDRWLTLMTDVPNFNVQAWGQGSEKHTDGLDESVITGISILQVCHQMQNLPWVPGFVSSIENNQLPPLVEEKRSTLENEGMGTNNSESRNETSSSSESEESSDQELTSGSKKRKSKKRKRRRSKKANKSKKGKSKGNGPQQTSAPDGPTAAKNSFEQCSLEEQRTLIQKGLTLTLAALQKNINSVFQRMRTTVGKTASEDIYPGLVTISNTNSSPGSPATVDITSDAFRTKLVENLTKWIKQYRQDFSTAHPHLNDVVDSVILPLFKELITCMIEECQDTAVGNYLTKVVNFAQATFDSTADVLGYTDTASLEQDVKQGKINVYVERSEKEFTRKIIGYMDPYLFSSSIVKDCVANQMAAYVHQQVMVAAVVNNGEVGAVNQETCRTVVSRENKGGPKVSIGSVTVPLRTAEVVDRCGDKCREHSLSLFEANRKEKVDESGDEEDEEHEAESENIFHSAINRVQMKMDFPRLILGRKDVLNRNVIVTYAHPTIYIGKSDLYRCDHELMKEAKSNNTTASHVLKRKDASLSNHSSGGYFPNAGGDVECGGIAAQLEMREESESMQHGDIQFQENPLHFGRNGGHGVVNSNMKYDASGALTNATPTELNAILMQDGFQASQFNKEFVDPCTIAEGTKRVLDVFHVKQHRGQMTGIVYHMDHDMNSLIQETANAANIHGIRSRGEGSLPKLNPIETLFVGMCPDPTPGMTNSSKPRLVDEVLLQVLKQRPFLVGQLHALIVMSKQADVPAPVHHFFSKKERDAERKSLFNDLLVQHLMGLDVVKGEHNMMKQMRICLLGACGGRTTLTDSATNFRLDGPAIVYCGMSTVSYISNAGSDYFIKMTALTTPPEQHALNFCRLVQKPPQANNPAVRWMEVAVVRPLAPVYKKTNIDSSAIAIAKKWSDEEAIANTLADIECDTLVAAVDNSEITWTKLATYMADNVFTFAGVNASQKELFAIMADVHPVLSGDGDHTLFRMRVFNPIYEEYKALTATRNHQKEENESEQPMMLDTGDLDFLQ